MAISIYCYLIKHKEKQKQLLPLYRNNNKLKKFYITNILQKYKNISIYDISYKTSTGGKPFHVRFNIIDGFLKINDGIRYLVLFNCSWCDKIFLIGLNMLQVKKVVLQTLIIILQESELIHLILYPLKKC